METFSEPTQLVITGRTRAIRIDEHPVSVYLARLAPGSRRTMKEALAIIAELISGKADALAVTNERYWRDALEIHSECVPPCDICENVKQKVAVIDALKGALAKVKGEG